MYNHKRSYPVLPKYPGTLNDSLCNSSSTEAGVRVAIIGHGPILPVGGTYYHWTWVTRPHRYFTSRRGEIPFTYPAAPHPCTRGDCPRERTNYKQTNRGYNRQRCIPDQICSELHKISISGCVVHSV
ncbi:hypothetical protein AVEN_148335-1 [Araneus ventricosus]|uniref:Uncharacterized protein n=1 Tax=Araneus ventricosus TaxID=182803 RepID=A0A4Y2LKG3_ARAVE|nr:hypothetical protein AVEN_273605-1 [Araneus ventricosus]GBN15256.1 hypothetical protein AVEN_113177-1 [Araneus ventricosus]GBN15264.1 hypothetical protein AVEN_124528-1 [Araneus ventricosus]GBN15271.1 hypothetical protein AVEN_148335-1 [Araneus ventricosus]